MNVKTTTARFRVSPAELFDFFSQIENLPRWATGYCKAVRKDGEDWWITTPDGEVLQVFKSNAQLGTVDMYAGPNRDQLWCWPARITSDNMGGSVLAFTAIQMPGQPDDVFDGQCAQLSLEFENIRNLIERPDQSLKAV